MCFSLGSVLQVWFKNCPLHIPNWLHPLAFFLITPTLGDKIYKQWKAIFPFKDCNHCWFCLFIWSIRLSQELSWNMLSTSECQIDSAPAGASIVEPAGVWHVTGKIVKLHFRAFPCNYFASWESPIFVFLFPFAEVTATWGLSVNRLFSFYECHTCGQ